MYGISLMELILLPALAHLVFSHFPTVLACPCLRPTAAANSSVTQLSAVLQMLGRRWRACALATVRRSNCTCGFPAYSFHEDSRFRDAIEGISWIRFTSPYSPYSLVSGNCRQP